jgi:predicted LPLAT superfamily acyltransferase
VSTTDAAPPQAPHLGRSYRLLGRFHVTGVFWYRLPHWGFTRLPSWIDGVVVAVFTAVFWTTLRRIRAAIASNLEPVLGPASGWRRWRRAWRTMHTFGWCLAERYRYLATPARFHASVEGEANWRAAFAAGRGAVVVTAHVGPWENAVRFGATDARRRIHVVREKELDPRAQEFVSELVAHAGPEYVTHFADGDPALGLELVKALRAGDIVAVQADRPRSGGQSIEARVFGRPLSLPIGPAALARAAEVPIVPVFNFREGRFRLRSVARPLILVARTADRDRDLASAVERLGAEVEWAIRRAPHQWFCFRRLWD